MVNPAIASASVSILVALASLGMAYAAYRGFTRRSNPALLMVTGAFLVITLRNVFSAGMVMTHLISHDAIELILSLFDLVVILLFALPLLMRR